MTKSKLAILPAILMCSALTAPVLAATRHPSPHAGLPHYVLFDVGTFGGGFGLYSNPGARVLNGKGTAVGVDATGQNDPFDPNCFFDCHVDHAFQWKNGGTTDLGSLRYDLSSWALAINDKGLIAGVSQNGDIDPGTGVYEARPVVWKNGKIQDLGTLGGTQGTATDSINSAGQVPIASTNSDSNDPYINAPQANCLWLVDNGTVCNQGDFAFNALFLPATTQVHGGLWSKESGLKDLGTLGGPDSFALDINDAGQLVGWSYTSFTAGASGVPDTHPFLLENGIMTDLGTLGGTFAAPVQINKNGEVTGASNLAGDTVVRTFVWDKTNGMRDLGSLGGWYTHPNWINDLGDVVGISSYPDDTRRAVYWPHDGGMIDLGTLGTDDRSVAIGINNKREIVGYTFTNDGSELRGFASDNGGGIVDLNTLVRKLHGLYILAAYYVNDRGEIVGIAETKKGDIHPVVLVPENDFQTLAQMKRIGSNVPQAATQSFGVQRASALCGKGHARLRICAAQ
jgi:probable HAF family extracellular repeat protein